MHFNVLKLCGALEEFSITLLFWVLKCKHLLFEENKRFEYIFYQSEVWEIKDPSSRLEKKNTKYFNFAYNRFLMIFLKVHFLHCPIFLKTISCIY